MVKEMRTIMVWLLCIILNYICIMDPYMKSNQPWLLVTWDFGAILKLGGGIFFCCPFSQLESTLQPNRSRHRHVLKSDHLSPCRNIRLSKCQVIHKSCAPPWNSCRSWSSAEILGWSLVEWNKSSLKKKSWGFKLSLVKAGMMVVFIDVLMQQSSWLEPSPRKWLERHLCILLGCFRCNFPWLHVFLVKPSPLQSRPLISQRCPRWV